MPSVSSSRSWWFYDDVPSNFFESMNLVPSSAWRISRSAFFLSLPFYAVLTLANFVRFLPNGIFPEKFGGSGAETGVGELFGRSQDIILPVAVLAATLVAAAAHLSHRGDAPQ